MGRSNLPKGLTRRSARERHLKRIGYDKKSKRRRLRGGIKERERR